MLTIDSGMQNSLDKYAEVILKIGLGFTSGQRLHITILTEFEYITPEIIYLVRKISELAYNIGAKNVLTEWGDGELTRLRLIYSPLEGLDDIPPLASEQRVRFMDDNGAFLSIEGRNPDLMEGIDQVRVGRLRKARGKQFHDSFQRIMRNEVTWLAVNVPVVSWAKKVYPVLSDADSIERLWHTIFELSRVTGENPVADWQQHVANTRQRANYLNRKQYVELRYKAPGTDLRVGMPHDHFWEGADSISKSGIQFVANIPAEEVFTMPDCRKVNGFVLVISHKCLSV